jgi:hypothetical protein
MTSKKFLWFKACFEFRYAGLMGLAEWLDHDGSQN